MSYFLGIFDQPILSLSQASLVYSHPHWIYLMQILSNYNTQSFYPIENSVIVALKSNIVTSLHVKTIKLISGFNLTNVKNPPGHKIIKNESKNFCISTFDSPYTSGTPWVSKEAPLSIKQAIGGFAH